VPHSAHLDGCSVIVLRTGHRGFSVVESGALSFDGETLHLGDNESVRVFTENEQRTLLPVSRGNRIRECRGFDYFIVDEVTP